MPDFFHNRLRADANHAMSSRGNVNIHRLMAQWIKDDSWCSQALAHTHSDLVKRLSDLGTHLFDSNIGRYTSELRSNCYQLSEVWTDEYIEVMLRQHCELLCVGLADIVGFQRRANDVIKATNIIVNGMQHLHDALRTARGVILLSVYQDHPGYMLASSGVPHSRFSAVRYDGGGHESMLLDGIGLTQIPASTVGARRMLKTLACGDCVAVYNDFVYPSSKPITGILFGRPVLISRSLVRMILSHNAIVIPMSITRTLPVSRQEMHVTCFSPVDCSRICQNANKSVEAGALALSIAAECLIRRRPAQWRLWNTLTSRWKEAVSLGCAS